MVAAKLDHEEEQKKFPEDGDDALFNFYEPYLDNIWESPDKAKRKNGITAVMGGDYLYLGLVLARAVGEDSGSLISSLNGASDGALTPAELEILMAFVAVTLEDEFDRKFPEVKLYFFTHCH